MSEIVLLSDQRDEARIPPMLDALVTDWQDVKWLRIDHDAEHEHPEIVEAIAASRCAILIWSEHSASEEAGQFHTLARAALDANKAICVLIDDVSLPPNLSGCTVYDVRGWRSEPDGWRKLLGGNLYMRDLVAGAKFKVAGMDPPPPRAPRDMLIRHVIAIVPAVFALLAAPATLLGAFDNLNLLDWPSAAEASDWEQTDRDDCTALRTFLKAHPDGHYTQEAQGRLDGAEPSAERHWEEVERPQPIYIAQMGAEPQSSQDAALSLAQTRAAEEAETACSGLARAGNAKLIEARLGELSQECSGGGNGFTCSLDGEALCVLSEPRDKEVEDCSQSGKGD